MSQPPPYAASRTVWSGRQPFQGLLLAIGLSIAGVPGSAMLGFIGLLFAITQIGAPFLIVIWGGAAWWLFGHKHLCLVYRCLGSVRQLHRQPYQGPGSSALACRCFCRLRYWRFSGGFVSFGFLGLFIGPTLLAVFFTLLQTWRAAARSGIYRTVVAYSPNVSGNHMR